MSGAANRRRAERLARRNALRQQEAARLNRARRVERRNRFRLAPLMNNQGALYRSFLRNRTIRFDVRAVEILIPNPSLEVMYAAISRFRRNNPSLFNVAYSYLVRGREQWSTLANRHLDTFDAFSTEIARQLGQLPGQPGSGTLLLDDDPDEMFVDTSRFDAYVERFGFFQPPARNPFGPRGGEWEHPKGLGGLYASLHPDASADTFCVRRLAEALLKEHPVHAWRWEALSEAGRNDWEVFTQTMHEIGKHVVRVDPCRITIPYVGAANVAFQLLDDFQQGILERANHYEVVLQQRKDQYPIIYIPLEKMPVVDTQGPFEEVEFPVLYQNQHVEVPLLDENRRLTLKPGEFWVRLMPNSENNLVDVKLIKPQLRKNSKPENHPSFRTGPLNAIFDDNVSRGWKYGPTQFYDSSFNLLSEEGDKEMFVSFDVETGVVSERHGGRNSFEPFSASWCYIDSEDMKAPDWEFELKLPDYKETRTFDSVGKDCVIDFLDWVEHNSRRYKKVTVVTVNGAKFDHEFLLAAVMRRANNSRYEAEKPKNLHLTNNKMVAFTWGKASVFDLNLHIPASLSKMGKDFGIPQDWRKIDDGPEHTTIQDLFARFGFDMWTSDELDPTERGDLNDYREYGLNDARATILVYRKYVRALQAAGMNKVEQTIGAQAMKAFKASLPKIKEQMLPEMLATHTKEELEQLTVMNGLLPALTIEEMEEERRNVVAGAVKLPQGPVVIAGHAVESYDVASQYPTSMTVDSDGWYGCGLRDLVEHEDGSPLSPEECKLDTHVGKFRIDVDQSSLYCRTGHVVIPFKEMGTKLSAMGEEVAVGLKNHWDMDHYQGNFDEAGPKLRDWYQRGLLTDVLVDNLELKMLLEQQCEVVIKKAWIYRCRIPGWMLFEVEHSWIAAKSAQDALKGQPGYNEALRNTMKLLANAMSGKTMQGFYLETFELVREQDLMKKFKAYEAKGFGVTLRMAAEGMWFLQVNKLKAHVADKQYPIEWGKKIYSVSRMRILRTTYLPLGRDMIYGDTDCVKAYRNVFEARIKPLLKAQRVPAHPKAIERDPAYNEISMFYEPGDEHDKRIGQFEDEHDNMQKEDETAWRGAIAAKKMFALTDGSKIKISAKGMRSNSRYMDELEGAAAALGMRMDRQNMNRLGKKLALLPPNVDREQLKQEYRQALLDYERSQRRLQNYYEDYEAAPVKARQMDFVHKLEELVRGDTKTIYGVTMSFNRIRNFARPGTSMEDVYDNHVDNCRIVPVYAVKKITLPTADYGALLTEHDN